VLLTEVSGGWHSAVRDHIKCVTLYEQRVRRKVTISVHTTGNQCDLLVCVVYTDVPFTHDKDLTTGVRTIKFK
jgi:hypothetical protein